VHDNTLLSANYIYKWGISDMEGEIKRDAIRLAILALLVSSAYYLTHLPNPDNFEPNMVEFLWTYSQLFFSFSVFPALLYLLSIAFVYSSKLGASKILSDFLYDSSVLLLFVSTSFLAIFISALKVSQWYGFNVMATQIYFSGGVLATLFFSLHIMKNWIIDMSEYTQEFIRYIKGKFYIVDFLNKRNHFKKKSRENKSFYVTFLGGIFSVLPVLVLFSSFEQLRNQGYIGLLISLGLTLIVGLIFWWIGMALSEVISERGKFHEGFMAGMLASFIVEALRVYATNCIVALFIIMISVVLYFVVNFLIIWTGKIG
jgi:hypothetical protein